MRITNKTPYNAEFEQVEQYLTEQSANMLKSEAEKLYGSMYDLQFARFFECMNGDFSGVLGDLRKPTVLQVYWCKRFVEFAEQFAETLKQLQIKPTAEEQRASQGLLQVSWSEGLLVFMQQFFGLKGYKQAERITIGELLIAKRAAFNQAKYDRALARLQAQKYSKK